MFGNVFRASATVCCQPGGTSSLIIRQNHRRLASRTICRIRPARTAPVLAVPAQGRIQPEELVRPAGAGVGDGHVPLGRRRQRVQSAEIQYGDLVGHQPRLAAACRPERESPKSAGTKEICIDCMPPSRLFRGERGGPSVLLVGVYADGAIIVLVQAATVARVDTSCLRSDERLWRKSTSKRPWGG